MKTRASAEFLSAIVEHVAHPIFVKDREFRFVLLNQAFFDMVGFSRDEMLGKTDYDFFPKEQADFFRKKDVELFSSGASVQIDEEPITDEDGEVHILSTTKVPFRNEDGEVTHLVGIVKDITVLKRAEEALRDANEELERRVAERTAQLAKAHSELLRRERLAVLGQLSGGLAHQLRNPLGAIQNAVALLRHPAGEEQSQRALAIIDEEVSRADRTIRDLLDYAAIRSPEPWPVDVVGLLEQVVDLEHPPEHVRVRVLQDEEVLARADESQLLAALGNIVRNAIEAVEHGEQPLVEIGIYRRKSRIFIEIHDNGDGIDDSAEPRIFEPLVTTKPLGIGLGLPTARSLIENQGGYIRFARSPLGGAAFTIELPVPGEPHTGTKDE